jgi:hypothetical protein
MFSTWLVIGCVSSSLPHGSKQHESGSRSILDLALADTNVISERRAIELDLVGDEWRKGVTPRPGDINISRSQRESALALRILDSLQTRLQSMEPSMLLMSLKTVPYGDSGDFSGVAYYVYMVGNARIMDILNNKSRAEIQALSEYRNDRQVIFLGDNGPVGTVGDFVRNTLLDNQ